MWTPYSGPGHFTRQEEKAAVGMSEKGRGGELGEQAALGCGGSSACLLSSHDWACLCHRSSRDSSVGQGSVLFKYCSLKHRFAVKCKRQRE